MNKQEKVIAILLGLALAGWLWYSIGEQKKAAEAARAYALAHPELQQQAAPAAAKPQAAAAVQPKAPAAVPKRTAPRAPEQLVTLANDQVEVVLTTHGGAVKRAQMKKYAEKPGALSEKNPALVLDFAESPALALEGVPGLDAEADFTVAGRGADFVLFKNALGTRKITLRPDYRLELEETFAQPGATPNRLSLGAIAMGSSKNDLLSIDSYCEVGEKPRVIHHGDDGDSPLKGLLVSALGGCSGAKKADGLEAEIARDVPGRCGWVAVKNRFFVAALASASAPNEGFAAVLRRDTAQRDYVLRNVSAAVRFPQLAATRTSTFYIGPKKQALLWDLGLKDVMEFGMWRWLCYPLVWVLNAFNGLIPNYGVAIILLTILVRLLFWPLTHKSTLGMRKMQEIQPKMKAIQKQFKDNPKRLQQETMALYRTEKVNPMSSCLPMLVQIPVFIALFTVLRSAVELRYAPFLWITDLSEPEALGATSWFPFFGGLNILPLAMAGLTMLQSAFTPTSGDNKQQQMMMIMMPLMMLFMFYNFPSALSLYWALSTAFGVGQAWWIKHKYGAPAAQGDVVEPDAVEMPQTRQMRRHG